jgi:hypothetical protein
MDLLGPEGMPSGPFLFPVGAQCSNTLPGERRGALEPRKQVRG